MCFSSWIMCKSLSGYINWLGIHVLRLDGDEIFFKHVSCYFGYVIYFALLVFQIPIKC